MPGTTDARPVARLMNFGIDGPPTSNRLRILWLRADIVYDASNEDPYNLATRLSPTDFWESGIIRHRYGWSRNLARLMTRFQYPDPNSGVGRLHLTHENGIRMLYKRLKRMHSTIAFEYLERFRTAGNPRIQERGLVEDRLMSRGHSRGARDSGCFSRRGRVRRRRAPVG